MHINDPQQSHQRFLAPSLVPSSLHVCRCRQSCAELVNTKHEEHLRLYLHCSLSYHPHTDVYSHTRWTRMRTCTYVCLAHAAKDLCAARPPRSRWTCCELGCRLMQRLVQPGEQPNDAAATLCNTCTSRACAVWWGTHLIQHSSCSLCYAVARGIHPSLNCRLLLHLSKYCTIKLSYLTSCLYKDAACTAMSATKGAMTHLLAVICNASCWWHCCTHLIL